MLQSGVFRSDLTYTDPPLRSNIVFTCYNNTVVQTFQTLFPRVYSEFPGSLPCSCGADIRIAEAADFYFYALYNYSFHLFSFLSHFNKYHNILWRCAGTVNDNTLPQESICQRVGMCLSSFFSGLPMQGDSPMAKDALNFAAAFAQFSEAICKSPVLAKTTISDLKVAGLVCSLCEFQFRTQSALMAMSEDVTDGEFQKLTAEAMEHRAQLGQLQGSMASIQEDGRAKASEWLKTLHGSLGQALAHMRGIMVAAFVKANLDGKLEKPEPEWPDDEVVLEKLLFKLEGVVRKLQPLQPASDAEKVSGFDDENDLGSFGFGSGGRLIG